MDKKLLISVIIPVYNAEKYLEKCLDSVERQSTECCEIILVNDGSTDNSGQICLNYQKRYNNINYLYQKNMGQGSARNAGVRKAQGKWLFFLDADDELIPGALKKIEEHIRDNEESQMVFLEYGFHGKRNTEYIRMQLPEYAEEKEEIMMEMTSYLWDKLFQRELWEAADIRLENLYGEDILPVYCMAVEAKSVSVIHYPAVLHYEREGNLSAQPVKVLQILESLKHTLRYFEGKKWLGNYKEQLQSMIISQYKFYRFFADLGNESVQKKIVDGLAELLLEWFPEEYNVLIQCAEENLVYIGEVSGCRKGDPYFRSVLYYDTLEKFCVDGRVLEGQCHFILNLDGDFAPAECGTRSFAWIGQRIEELCKEFLEIRKEKGITGKIALYAGENSGREKGEIVKRAQSILQCGWYDCFIPKMTWIKKEEVYPETVEIAGAPFDYRQSAARREYTFDLMYQWLKVKMKNKSAADFFVARGYKKIAVYGASYIGGILWEELEAAGLEVSYFIDIGGQEEFCGRPVYKPDRILPETDIVVITVLYHYNIIKEQIINCCDIVSIGDVVQKCLNGEE